MKNGLSDMRPVLLLTITQGLSAMGSAINMVLLSVCSYVPYILMSIFAGALSDRWDKKKPCSPATRSRR